MNKYLNIFVKTILIISSLFLLFNIALFLFLLTYSEGKPNETITEKFNRLNHLMYASYSFIFFIIHGLLYGQEPFVPPPEIESKKI